MRKTERIVVLLIALAASLIPGAALAQNATPTAKAQQPPVDGNAAQAGAACQVFKLSRGADTWLSSMTPGTGYGSDAKLTTDGNPQSTALIRWDLSTVPAGTQMAFAAVLVHHADPKDESATTFQVYAMRRPWSDKDATWTAAGPGMRWAAPGAADPITDHESTSMGQTPVIRKSPALARIDLNDEGVAQVNRWLGGIEPNYGIAIQDFRSGDAFRFGSFESAFPPQLVLSTCAQSGELEAALPTLTGTAETASASSPSPQAPSATATRQISPLATPEAQVTPAPQTGIAGRQIVSFQDGVAPDSRYDGTQDTYVNQNVPGGNYGTAPVAWLAGGGAAGRRASTQALIRWDVAEIPAGSEVVSATIILNALVASPGEYNVYEARRAWDEASLTWTSRGNSSWLSEGAGRFDSSAVPLGVYRSAAPGPVVIELDEPGVAAVQRWIDDPSQNFGVVIATSEAQAAASFATSDASVAANRPHLTISYR